MKVKDILADFDAGLESGQARDEPAPEILGPYALLEEIGEGAFGTVWRAQQSTPVQREVALKLLKVGMDTAEILARFEQERHTLARMDHPNIAQIFDAGANSSGRPYFVMELVHPCETLTDYCKSRQIPLAQRLTLFREICLAIQHAHQKGIIHRDIKPSNILISASEPPRVKVIDFGIAKVFDEADGNPALLTRIERVMGTPAYMSPEHLANPRDVDTRSDVYSLGVILYELLTDSLPFDPQTTTPFTQIKKPSLTSQRSSKAAIQGDLDCIALKCLEPDRQRRYQSSGDLLADLDRHLSHQPIMARAPEGAYLIAQFYKRHQAAVIGVGAFIFALLLGLLFTGLMYQKEQTARRLAQIESQKSREIAWFLRETLSSAGYSKSLGRDATLMNDLLQDAHQRIEGSETMAPTVEIEIRRILGTTFLDLENYSAAVTQFEHILTLTQQAQSANPPAQARALFDLADALECNQQQQEAEKRLLELLSLEGQNPTALTKQNPVYFEARVLLAWLFAENGKTEEAQELAQIGYQEWLRNPTNEAYQTFPTVYASILTQLGRCEEAKKVYQAELDLRRQLHPAPHPLKVKALAELGQNLFHAGAREEARQLLLESLQDGRVIFGSMNPHGEQALSLLANIEELEGNRQQGLAYRRRAYRVACATAPPATSYRISAGQSLQDSLFAMAQHAIAEDNWTLARKLRDEISEFSESQTDFVIDSAKLDKLSSQLASPPSSEGR